MLNYCESNVLFNSNREYLNQILSKIVKYLYLLKSILNCIYYAKSFFIRNKF